ncbi:MAG: GNAT family protein [Planctomycetota bacterium]
MNYERITPATRDELVEWLMSDTWPFHGRAIPDRTRIEAMVDGGAFWGDEAEAFWIHAEQHREGVVRLFDLDDPSPLFDLRLKTASRGRGIGTAAVRWLTSYLFESRTHLRRVAGYTRIDNIGMRRVFERCGYVKEAHHREEWSDADGRLFDAVGYGVLRSDWENGTTTPVHWTT